MLNSIFSFVADIGEHKGMHENKIDNHEINKDMNSTKCFTIYISTQNRRAKCKIKN